MHSKLMILSLVCVAVIISTVLAEIPTSPPTYRYECVKDSSVCSKANVTSHNHCCYYNQKLSVYTYSYANEWQCWCNPDAPPKGTPNTTYSCMKEAAECYEKPLASRWRYRFCCYGDDEMLIAKEDLSQGLSESCYCNPK